LQKKISRLQIFYKIVKLKKIKIKKQQMQLAIGPKQANLVSISGPAQT
jgi:hypothetical protein